MTEREAVWRALKIEVEFHLFLVENTHDYEKIEGARRTIHALCDRLDKIEKAASANKG